MALTATRTRVRYFNDEGVKALLSEIRSLEDDLNRRAPFIEGAAYTEALDRLDAVRLTVKRLSDVVPE